MRGWFAVLLLGAALSGCFGDDEPQDVAPETTDDAMEGDAPPPVFGPHSGLPLERPADWRPRLDAPPQWTLGEWWDVEATGNFDGTQYSIKRVVAGKEGPDYLVGMPIDAFDDEIMVLHHPGMGIVRSSTLGYETHDFMWEPVRFPLEVGNSWESLWQSASGVVTHTVESVDEQAMTANIVTTGAISSTYVYDANLGVVASFDAPSYMTWEVVAHGFDHNGTVRVPHTHDMHIFHGRIGPVIPVQLSEGVVASATGQCVQAPVVGCIDAAPPVESFTVPEGYDRASFSIIIVDLPAFLTGAPVAAGIYQVSGTAPDGTTFEATHLPTDGAVTIDTYAVEEPIGTWDLTTLSAGAGQAFIEGVVYITFDVELPSGCVLMTSKVHDHGGNCGGHVHDIE